MLFTCTIPAVKAQYDCGYSEPTPIRSGVNNCTRTLPTSNLDTNLLMSTFVPDSSTAIITIPVNINIWRTDEGTGNYWENTPALKDSLRKVFGFLNWLYSQNQNPSDPIPGAKHIPDTKVRFVIDTFYYYNNSSLCYNDDVYSLTSYLSICFPERLKNFNYHLTINTTAGYSGVSSGYNSIYPAINTVKQDHQQHLYALAVHMAHEFGHNFGLKHSYNTECNNISNPEFLWDLFGTATQPWCNKPAGTVCYHDAGWGLDPYDPTNTSTNNIMGGTSSACNFTALQCGRIHRALSVSTLRKFAWGYSQIPLTITANTTFDATRKFYQNVVVDSGVTLTVTCRMEMVDSARIIVRPGGKLIVDGGVLTSAGNIMWKGVIVEGNPDSARLERCQGTIILLNGAEISNALCGVNIQGGGIIKATSSGFTNNLQGVAMQEYNHGQVVSSYIPLRKTYFRNCTFTINSNAFFSNSFTHVSLIGIQDAAFVSCSFTDTRNNLYLDKLGTGIYAFHSSIETVDGNDYMFTPVKNLFSGLGTGISVQNSYENTSRISDCRFTNNSAGIHAVNADYLICRDNVFEIEHPIYGIVGNTHGIILEESTQYTIYNNLFSGVGTYSIGISFENTGIHNNMVKRNTFEDLYVACYVNGCNGGNGNTSVFDMKGLAFECNRFLNQSLNDIFVSTGATIHPFQGALWQAAGNYFTSATNIVNNNADLIQYYYESNEVGHMPNSVGNVLLRATQGNSCGDYGYIEGHTPIENVSLSSLELQYNSANDQYQVVSAAYENNYGYQIPTVMIGNQESDFAELLTYQWQLTDICNSAIYKITSDSVFNVTLYETWLERASTIGCYFALAESYFHHNNSAFNSLKKNELSRALNTQDYTNLTSLYALRHAVGNGDLGWKDLDSLSVCTLKQIAVNNDHAGAIAKSVLTAYYGQTYRYDSLHLLFPVINFNDVSQDFVQKNASEPTPNAIDEQQKDGKRLYVHPIPANDVIHVSFDGVEMSKIFLLDMQGRILWKSTDESQTAVIPCARISSGIYILSVTANGKQYFRKVIVE